jgi:Amt family ammonium transporter
MAISAGYSFVVSYAIFKFINFILPLRVTAEEEEIGLDATQHNEKYLQGTLLVTNNGAIHEEEAID